MSSFRTTVARRSAAVSLGLIASLALVAGPALAATASDATAVHAANEANRDATHAANKARNDATHTTNEANREALENETELVAFAWAVPWEKERLRRLVGLGNRRAITRAEGPLYQGLPGFGDYARASAQAADASLRATHSSK